MSAVEIVKKRGRPKRLIEEMSALAEEPSLAKSPKSRTTTRKTTTTSPTKKKQASAGTEAQVTKHDQLPASPQIRIKEPGSRLRSSSAVAAEKPATASEPTNPSLVKQKSSIISRQATAFARLVEDNSPSRTTYLVEEGPEADRKEFKSAGTPPTLPSRKAEEPGLSSDKPPALTTSKPTSSLFLSSFLTDPPVTEQPAWSRPKKSASESTFSSSVPQAATAIASTSLPGNPNALSSFSADPAPTTPESSPSLPPEAHPPSPAVIQTTPAEMSTKAPPQQPPPPLKQVHPPASQPSHPLSHKPNKPLNIPRGLGPQAAQPLKPTEMPYEVLRRDPKFKSLSRKYTSLIVAIPILLATSYVLYERHTGATVQRKRGVDTANDTVGRTMNGGV